jgi:hypothetical protein
LDDERPDDGWAGNDDRRAGKLKASAAPLDGAAALLRKSIKESAAAKHAVGRSFARSYETIRRREIIQRITKYGGNISVI